MAYKGVAINFSPSTKGELSLLNVKSIKLENGSFLGMMGNYPVGGGSNPSNNGNGTWLPYVWRL